MFCSQGSLERDVTINTSPRHEAKSLILKGIHSNKRMNFLCFSELNRWKRDQQLSGNGAPFTNNLDTIQKWCEDLAEIIWINMQQIRQLEMIQEQLNIPSQELTVNILPELSDGLTMLLDSLVKSSFVIGEFKRGATLLTKRSAN